jgi:hypothetical protein
MNGPREGRPLAFFDEVWALPLQLGCEAIPPLALSVSANSTGD